MRCNIITAMQRRYGFVFLAVLAVLTACNVVEAKIYINGSNSADSYIMELPDTQQPYSYYIYYPWYALTGTIAARNGTTGRIDYRGADFYTVYNSASNALAAGGVIEIGAGTFDINTNLVPHDNTWTRGQGIGRTILRGTASLGVNPIIKRRSNTVPATSKGVPATNIKITDLELDGSQMDTAGNTGGKGIFIQYFNNSEFRNIYIHDTPTSCFGNDYGQNILYDNDMAVNCGRAHPTAAAGESPGGSGFGIGTGEYSNESTVITNSYAFNNWFAGVTFEAVVNNATSKYMIATNTYSRNNTYGFVSWASTAALSENSKVKFVGNTAEDNTDSGIYIYRYSNDVLISGNILENNTVGIKNERSKNFGAVVVGNIINGSSTYGIYANGSDAIYESNKISKSGKSGVRISDKTDQSSSDIIFSNNLIFDSGLAGVVGDNDGVRIDSTTGAFNVTNVTMTGNRIFDDRGASATQRYGLVITVKTNNIVANINVFYGNTAGSIIDNSQEKAMLMNNWGVSPYQFGNRAGRPGYSWVGEGDEYTNTTSHLKCFRNSTVFVNLQNYTVEGC